MTINFIVSLLLVSFCVRGAIGQESVAPSQAWQERLVAQLSRGNEEQRLDAAAQLSGLFDAAPDSATSETIGTLTQALQHDPSPVIRALVARAFEACCGEKGIPVLLKTLTNEREIAVRKASIYALSRHHSLDIVSAILPLLNDKEPEIRGAAAYTIAEIGDSTTADALSGVLQKRQKPQDSFARSQAARGLGKIGDRAAINILLESLIHDKSEDVRREAATSLGLIATKGDRRVIEVLNELTSGTDPYLTSIVLEALRKINLRES